MTPLVLLLLVAIAGAQDTQTPDGLTPDPLSTANLGTELVNGLFNSDFFQSKLQSYFKLVDLKVRFVKLVSVLLSRENLLVWRQCLEFVVRACNFAIDFLPVPTDEPRTSFLSTLFPTLNLGAPQEDFGGQRVNRDLNVTSEDQELLESHRDDVIQVARLLYNTP